MPVQEFRISPLEGDPNAHEAIRETGIDDIASTRVYRFEGDITPEQLHMLAVAIADPVTESIQYGEREDWDDPYIIEVGVQPSATNAESDSMSYLAGLLGIDVVETDSGTEYHIPRNIPRSTLEEVTPLLYNATIEEVRRGTPETLVIGGERGSVRRVAFNNLTDDQLEEFSQESSMYLDQTKMRAIQKYFKEVEGREPTYAELQTFGAGWSEHCAHPTFKAEIHKNNGEVKEGLFGRIKSTARKYFEKVGVVTAFEDNSGGIEFFDGWAITGKVETHNSPSIKEPLNGAATGTGGVLRDTAGTGDGAKPILSTDHFCYANVRQLVDALGKTEKAPPAGVSSADYLLRRVIEGVEMYGNRMGVPTSNGSIHFHEDFRAKPSVIVGSYGLQTVEGAKRKVAKTGDLVVAVGGRTGRDGIHGANMSSITMDEDVTTKHSTAVQIGYPIMQKPAFDAILEAQEAGLIEALTDCGAAGFASAVGEMGEDAGGVRVDLSDAPLKYEGLDPWEIWISESQERMVLAIDPENIEAVQAIFEKHGSEASVLGEFTDTNRLEVLYDGEHAVDLDYDFYGGGGPVDPMLAEWDEPDLDVLVPERLTTKEAWAEALRKIMSHGNICSKEQIVRQFDHEVQGGNVMKPYGGLNDDAPNDACVLCPIPGEDYAFVQAHGMNPALNQLDPTRGTKWAIAEAVANFAAAGGDIDKAALINNFITGTPTPHIMDVLDQMVDAICDGMDSLEVPVISGKDSLSSTYVDNETGEVIEIPPVIMMSIFGGIEDAKDTVSTDIKAAGESVLVRVGSADYESMGGSTFHDIAGGQGGSVPNVDLDEVATNARLMRKAILSGKVYAAHDISEGGLATTVAEMCFGGDCGAEIDMRQGDITPEQFMFNETAGGYVVEVADLKTAQELFGDAAQFIGRTTESKRMTFFENGPQNIRQVFGVDIDDLRAANKRPMEEFYELA